MHLTSKLNVSLKLRGGGDVWLGVMWVSCCCTDTGLSSGMHLGSLAKFQGGGVVVKFAVFLHSYAVCLCCLNANDPLC